MHLVKIGSTWINPEQVATIKRITSDDHITHGLGNRTRIGTNGMFFDFPQSISDVIEMLSGEARGQLKDGSDRASAIPPGTGKTKST